MALHAIAVFTAAALFFVVQPMAARALLPVLGGAPSVWNTCAAFFQITLLAGYLYAHLGLAWLGPVRQAMLHCVLLVTVLPLLPPDGLARAVLPPDTAPAAWLLAQLTTALGLPLLLVASTGPLLQVWLHASRGVRDPAALYAASNAGSLVALLAYPFGIDRWIGTGVQLRSWGLGYVACLGLVIACALPLLRRRGAVPDTADPAAAERAPPLARALRWGVLAFAPSAALLGVTRFLSTDVAAVPLLWVVPLALYLLTFVLAFARARPIGHALCIRLLPIAVLAWAMAWGTGATEPVGLVVAIHLAVFFVAALLCHGALALERPAAPALTLFYLVIATGGALGGAFDALVAPAVFDAIVEYPLAIVLVCLLAPARGAPRRLSFRDLALAVLPAGIALAGAAVVTLPDLEGPARRALLLGLPAVVAFVLSDRPLRFALAIAGLLAVVGLDPSLQGTPLLVERSFFGVHRVTQRAAATDGTDTMRRHELYHGTTLHGAQRIDAVSERPAAPRDPLTYYHREGPIGLLFAAPLARPVRVGVVGLGAGALAAYAEPGDALTFFEIDPVVAAIASDERLFTYVSAARARGAVVRIELGDARRGLDATAERFDVLVLDAFGSDAVPVHLLTREAFALYERRIAPGGVIACNVSSRTLDLGPVVAAGAAPAGLVGWILRDTVVSPAETARSGRHPSEWIVLARTRAGVARLLDAPGGGRWQPLASASVAAWTDDRADLLAVLGRR